MLIFTYPAQAGTTLLQVTQTTVTVEATAADGEEEEVALLRPLAMTGAPEALTVDLWMKIVEMTGTEVVNLVASECHFLFSHFCS